MMVVLAETQFPEFLLINASAELCVYVSKSGSARRHPQALTNDYDVRGSFQITIASRVGPHDERLAQLQCAQVVRRVRTTPFTGQLARLIGVWNYGVDR